MIVLHLCRWLTLLSATTCMNKLRTSRNLGIILQTSSVLAQVMENTILTVRPLVARHRLQFPNNTCWTGYLATNRFPQYENYDFLLLDHQSMKIFMLTYTLCACALYSRSRPLSSAVVWMRKQTVKGRLSIEKFGVYPVVWRDGCSSGEAELPPWFRGGSQQTDKFRVFRHVLLHVYGEFKLMWWPGAISIH